MSEKDKKPETPKAATPQAPGGISAREFFAGVALHALIAREGTGNLPGITDDARETADALLAALEE